MPHCTAQKGGMECGRPVAYEGYQCDVCDPHAAIRRDLQRRAEWLRVRTDYRSKTDKGE